MDDSFRYRSVHFVGIGGIGMSALARLLLSQGVRVSGSDREVTQQGDALRQMGARVNVGHDSSNVDDADLVVRTTAIPLDNPELREAERRGVAVIKREELLAEVVNRARGIAVAGTHGKTTTTALIGHILTEAQLDPTVLVGGVSRNFGSNARIGSSDIVVAEADEYFEAFLYLRPSVAVINNIEPEHLDFFDSFDRLRGAFGHFASLVGDKLVVSEGVKELVRDNARKDVSVITFGFERADWQATRVLQGRGKTSFLVKHDDLTEAYESLLPGMHNVLNSVAALIVADHLAVPYGVRREALSTFAGVERRLEEKGEEQGVLVIDTYAHHPTEIRTDLRSVRQRYGRPVKLIFQPHTYTRTKAFLAEFGQAFGDADAVYVMDIYGAREEDSGLISSREFISEVARSHPNVMYTGDASSTIDAVLKDLRSGDIVITMGAGNVNVLAPRILKRISLDASAATKQLEG